MSERNRRQPQISGLAAMNEENANDAGAENTLMMPIVTFAIASPLLIHGTSSFTGLAAVECGYNGKHFKELQKLTGNC